MIYDEDKEPKRMLLIVDPQYDFINGSLPVAAAERAMDALAKYVRRHGADYEHICVTCDRHPLTHTSFEPYGGQWPLHCVEASAGAAIWQPLMDALLLYPHKVSILYKGERPEVDDYSILHCLSGAVKMDELLNAHHISEIDICGLAGDVCVAHTLADLNRMYEDIPVRKLEEFTAYIDPSNRKE